MTKKIGIKEKLNFLKSEGLLIDLGINGNLLLNGDHQAKVRYLDLISSHKAEIVAHLSKHGSATIRSQIQPNHQPNDCPQAEPSSLVRLSDLDNQFPEGYSGIKFRLEPFRPEAEGNENYAPEIDPATIQEGGFVSYHQSLHNGRVSCQWHVIRNADGKKVADI